MKKYLVSLGAAIALGSFSSRCEQPPTTDAPVDRLKALLSSVTSVNINPNVVPVAIAVETIPGNMASLRLKCMGAKLIDKVGQPILTVQDPFWITTVPKGARRWFYRDLCPYSKAVNPLSELKMIDTGGPWDSKDYVLLMPGESRPIGELSNYESASDGIRTFAVRLGKDQETQVRSIVTGETSMVIGSTQIQKDGPIFWIVDYSRGFNGTAGTVFLDATSNKAYVYSRALLLDDDWRRRLSINDPKITEIALCTLVHLDKIQ